MLAEPHDLFEAARLPTNLFFGVGIPACVLLNRRSQPSGRPRVSSMPQNTSSRPNRNTLRETDIERIVTAFRSTTMSSASRASLR